MDYRVLLLLGAEAMFALFLLYRAKILRSPASWVVAAALIAGAFLIRALALDYETLDYQNFLSRWVAFYRDNGGFRAIRVPLGNYNIPYLYFLALFSYSGIRDLYLIKLLSIFFDVLLAWGALRLCARFTDRPNRKLACFLTVLWLPTVVLNGAVWAQCDSIYVALLVLSLALALEDKPIRSMICLTLSFGFKLQAVFVMPVFLILLLYKKIRWQHLFLFPLTYLILVMPAVILGRPLLDTLTLYLSQTGSIGSGLNYNSPSVFAIFWRLQDVQPASTIAIAGAFCFMLLVLILARKQTDRIVLLAAVLLAIGIPFLLPHMHDRYFFAADILTLILAFSIPTFCLAAPLAQFASLLGYHAYLKLRYLLPMWYGSYALIAALVLVFAGYLHELKRSREQTDPPQGVANL